MTRVCPICKGEGELKINRGYPDPQQETWLICRRCWGTGIIEVDDRKAA